MNEDSTKRFSNRVANYVKYRPSYPEEIIPVLKDSYGIHSDQLLADIGAGTGISSELFLKAGYRVIGVEPNREMREKASGLLGHYASFSAVDGSAEHTGLPDHQVDVVVSGQAFHWFDRDRAKIEFQRILRAQGKVVLLWNERLSKTPFEHALDQLILTYGKDYVKLDHRNVGEQEIAEFFYPGTSALTVFSNEQRFDWDGLKGRLLSSSYIPVAGEPKYESMLLALRELYDRFRDEEGWVKIHYDVKVYVGSF